MSNPALEIVTFGLQCSIRFVGFTITTRSLRINPFDNYQRSSWCHPKLIPENIAAELLIGRKKHFNFNINLKTDQSREL